MAEPPRLRGPFTRALARLFVRDWRNPRDPEVSLRLGLLALGVAVTVNALLFGAKLGFGLYVGSLALIADALDTLGDILLDVVGLAALVVSLRAPDPEHPYGHQRAEEIASLTVAAVLVVIGLEFGLESGRRLVAGNLGGGFSWFAVGVALSSVVGKAAISLMARHLADYTRSPLLHVSAWHYVTDVFSGLLAAAAILGRRYGYGYLDPVFAMAIALLLVLVSLRIFRHSSNDLLGRGGDPEFLKQIHLVTCNQPGVLGCRDIEVHFYGRKKRVSLRIQVADNLTLREGHKIADRVQHALYGLHADWEPVVHVEPVPPNTPKDRHMEQPLGGAA
jgi:cation diffusion facilitator family transporter